VGTLAHGGRGKKKIGRLYAASRAPGSSILDMAGIAALEKIDARP
jgi:hypothetical protein